jgi:hypothetical protein
MEKKAVQPTLFPMFLYVKVDQYRVGQLYAGRTMTESTAVSREKAGLRLSLMSQTAALPISC